MLKKQLLLMRASECFSFLAFFLHFKLIGFFYFSMNLLGTVAKALGNSRRVQMMASLDHSMWFYEEFDMNKPLLFFMQTQISSHGRGLAMGRFYSQQGKLLAIVVSCCQKPRTLVVENLTFLTLIRRKKEWCAQKKREIHLEHLTRHQSYNR